MLARIRRPSEEREQGFTLTELLVVIVIIGILAAIAIPLYVNQQARARDSAAQSDVSGLGREIQAQLVNVGIDKIKVGVSGSGTNYAIHNGEEFEVLGGMSSTVTLRGHGGAEVAPGEAQAIGLMVRPKPTGSLTPGEGGDAEHSNVLSEQTWCIHVHTASGKEKSQRYSAQGGLEPGLCAVPGSDAAITIPEAG